jgi:hypothetical protein
VNRRNKERPRNKDGRLDDRKLKRRKWETGKGKRTKGTKRKTRKQTWEKNKARKRNRKQERIGSKRLKEHVTKCTHSVTVLVFSLCYCFQISNSWTPVSDALLWTAHNKRGGRRERLKYDRNQCNGLSYEMIQHKINFIYSSRRSYDLGIKWISHKMCFTFLENISRNISHSDKYTAIYSGIRGEAYLPVKFPLLSYFNQN